MQQGNATFTDQMGRVLTLAQWPPKRIVSLVPSQSELLAHLALDESVVGITKFCTHPVEWYQNKKRIGGTKTIDFQKVEALNPDLIIGNKEENDQHQIEYLSRKYPVWMSDIYKLGEALEMIRMVGQLCNRIEKSEKLCMDITQRFAQYSPPLLLRPRVVYLIWRKPYMAAGSETFIDNMLQQAGFENAFAGRPRYFEVTTEQIALARPDRIFLSSEPYPFAQKHLVALQEICPEAKIQLVDGALFSWYGSRLLEAPAYFATLRNG